MVDLAELETERLRMRRWSAADREPFWRMNRKPEVVRYLTPLTREGSDALLDRIDAHFEMHGWSFWALEEKSSGMLIGLCGLSHAQWLDPDLVEIGWRLDPAWHGQGFAREAAEASLTFGFDVLGLARIVAFTVPANTASWGLMERIGMRRVGKVEHPGLPQNDPLKVNFSYEIRNRSVGSD